MTSTLTIQHVIPIGRVLEWLPIWHKLPAAGHVSSLFSHYFRELAVTYVALVFLGGGCAKLMNI